jgi:hypothetical protein
VNNAAETGALRFPEVALPVGVTGRLALHSMPGRQECVAGIGSRNTNWSGSATKFSPGRGLAALVRFDDGPCPPGVTASFSRHNAERLFAWFHSRFRHQ